MLLRPPPAGCSVQIGQTACTVGKLVAYRPGNHLVTFVTSRCVEARVRPSLPWVRIPLSPPFGRSAFARQTTIFDDSVRLPVAVGAQVANEQRSARSPLGRVRCLRCRTCLARSSYRRAVALGREVWRWFGLLAAEMVPFGFLVGGMLFGLNMRITCLLCSG